MSKGAEGKRKYGHEVDAPLGAFGLRRLDPAVGVLVKSDVNGTDGCAASRGYEVWREREPATSERRPVRL